MSEKRWTIHTHCYPSPPRGFTVDVCHTEPLWIKIWRGEQLDAILQAIYANNNSQQSLTEAGDYESCFVVAAWIRVCNIPCVTTTGTAGDHHLSYHFRKCCSTKKRKLILFSSLGFTFITPPYIFVFPYPTWVYIQLRWFNARGGGGGVAPWLTH